MAPPWTAAQAASDEVSKKMLITYMQENADAAFLGTHKLSGNPNAVVKRVTKDQMVEAYTALLGGSNAGSSPSPAAAASPFGATASTKFSFSPPAGDSKSPQFTFNANAPPPAAPMPPPSNFTFNFNAPSTGADGDDDVEDIDTSTMAGKPRRGGGGAMGIPEELQRRMAKLNMSAAERREATLAELKPSVAKRVEQLETLQESVDELSSEFEAKLAKLREEYDKKKAPFFKQRSDVVNGKDGGEAVPGFWMQALQNNMIVAEEIQKEDEPILAHLMDIKCSSSLGGGKKGFQLAFIFSPNEFFEDGMLTKTYLMDPNDEDECLMKVPPPFSCPRHCAATFLATIITARDAPCARSSAACRRWART